MSTNATRAPLPDPRTAFNTLFQNVSAEVYFGKLASAGIQPRNQKEASDLMDLAGRLRAIEADPRTQKAAADASPYANILAELDQVMSANGLDSGVKAAQARDHEIAIVEAAARLAQDPAIYDSVLSVKAAQAQAYAAQRGA